MTNLLPGERIDDLQRKGYKIIQNVEKFCFGMDAVLLSSFATVKQGEKVLDMGTGTGIIPILLEAKTDGEHFTGLEIQAESAALVVSAFCIMSKPCIVPFVSLSVTSAPASRSFSAYRMPSSCRQSNFAVSI